MDASQVILHERLTQFEQMGVRLTMGESIRRKQSGSGQAGSAERPRVERLAQIRSLIA